MKIGSIGVAIPQSHESDDSEDRINALVAGFQMHVAKPVEPAELITVIAAPAK